MAPPGKTSYGRSGFVPRSSGRFQFRRDMRRILSPTRLRRRFGLPKVIAGGVVVVVLLAGLGYGTLRVAARVFDGSGETYQAQRLRSPGSQAGGSGSATEVASGPAPCTPTAISLGRSGVESLNQTTVERYVCIGDRAVVRFVDGTGSLAAVGFMRGTGPEWELVEQWSPADVRSNDPPAGFSEDDLTYFDWGRSRLDTSTG